MGNSNQDKTEAIRRAAEEQEAARRVATAREIARQARVKAKRDRARKKTEEEP